jgi:formate hydrogenlyase subunit 3/multisubunit Na+/H+ antiporter MnhD subunit
MIFTTIEDGLHYSPQTLSGGIEMHVRNQQRIRRWGYKRRNLRKPSIAGDIAVALLFVLIVVFGVAAWWAIESVPEPETRTFERPIDGTTYERTQQTWEINRE